MLAVIYLIFNEGYSSMSGSELVESTFVRKASVWRRCSSSSCRRRRTCWAGLCWLTEARRPGRTDENGELVLLADQDRTLWNRAAIDRGLSLLEHGRGDHSDSWYLIQAHIAPFTRLLGFTRPQIGG